jgi:AcrR family transcriptional regulator
MSPRHYVSPARNATAKATRTRLVAAATKLLRKSSSGGAVSLEAVARAAGVTRLTVYNQFGSRRGLLEAVFDERAKEGGLLRIAEAINHQDPHIALDQVIEIFCEFWSSDPSVGQLHRVADPEFVEAVAARNERRRQVIAALVGRMEPKFADDAARDLIDMMFALTSYAMFGMLMVNGRGVAEVKALIKQICATALSPLSQREQGRG